MVNENPPQKRREELVTLTTELRFPNARDLWSQAEQPELLLTCQQLEMVNFVSKCRFFNATMPDVKCKIVTTLFYLFIIHVQVPASFD